MRTLELAGIVLENSACGFGVKNSALLRCFWLNYFVDKCCQGDDDDRTRVGFQVGLALMCLQP